MANLEMQNIGDWDWYIFMSNETVTRKNITIHVLQF